MCKVSLFLKSTFLEVFMTVSSVPRLLSTPPLPFRTNGPFRQSRRLLILKACSAECGSHVVQDTSAKKLLTPRTHQSSQQLDQLDHVQETQQSPSQKISLINLIKHGDVTIYMEVVDIINTIQNSINCSHFVKP